MSERREDAEPAGWRKLVGPLLEIGPLLVFFAANGRWGILTGTAVFVGATCVALPLYRLIEGRWPIMPMVSGVFVLVFGGLTIWLQDELFIKMKPTIVNCLFGAILMGGLFFGRSFLKPLFRAAFRLTDIGWNLLTRRWALFFFTLAVINEIVWRNFSTDTWIASKMVVSLPLTLVFAVAQTPLLRRHWDGPDNPFKAG